MNDFPHPAYERHVLRPSFELAREHLFGPMLQANLAHVVMLARQGIISETKREALLAGLVQIEAEGIEALADVPGVEDLFFAIEQRLVQLTGPEIGGDLQLARSRNDLGAALHRMALRTELLRLIDALNDLRAAILHLAEDHLETVMPGYTHTQPAQPTTFAHYLGGILAALTRDSRRLQAAYATTNQSPLGTAAFTTTGFPIDREYVAALLGFDGVMTNGQDAIGAADYATEAASALMTIAAHLSRTTKDLLFWATQETHAIRIHDSFVQISSIMPQKRNPVVLEHLRARVGQVYGDGMTIFTLCHSSPYGDTQDVEDELMMPLLRLTDTAWGILDLFTAVFDTLEVNRDHLRGRAAAGFTTATELADTLVRDHGLAFRTAHSIVARVVKDTLATGRQASDVTAADVEAAAQAVAGHSLGLTDEAVRAALNPVRFVERRTIVGGPAPETMRASLAAEAGTLAADRDWLEDRRAALADAERALRTTATP
ncbi:MAG: argininosuccinate lyase [Anaerolineae bacterium]